MPREGKHGGPKIRGWGGLIELGNLEEQVGNQLSLDRGNWRSLGLRPAVAITVGL